MQFITNPGRKYQGTFAVYEPTDTADLPYLQFEFTKVKVGDWIRDDSGWIAQVLKINIAGKSRMVVTAFGTDVYTVVSSSGKVHKMKLDFKRERQFFSQLYKKSVRRITLKDQLFLRSLVMGSNVFDCYERCYSKKVVSHNDKYSVTYKLRSLMRSPQALEIMRTMIKDILIARGVDKPEWFIEKLIASVPDVIGKPVQLNIMKMLAKATGNTEIINVFSDEDHQQPSGDDGLLIEETEVTTHTLIQHEVPQLQEGELDGRVSIESEG